MSLKSIVRVSDSFIAEDSGILKNAATRQSGFGRSWF